MVKGCTNTLHPLADLKQLDLEEEEGEGGGGRGGGRVVGGRGGAERLLGLFGPIWSKNLGRRYKILRLEKATKQVQKA